MAMTLWGKLRRQPSWNQHKTILLIYYSMNLNIYVGIYDKHLCSMTYRFIFDVWISCSERWSRWIFTSCWDNRHQLFATAFLQSILHGCPPLQKETCAMCMCIPVEICSSVLQQFVVVAITWNATVIYTDIRLINDNLCVINVRNATNVIKNGTCFV